VPADTSVYGLTEPRYLADNLKFDHLIDELRNATDPASGLPKELLIDSNNLSKWTIPQISEHVDKINAWRASQQAEVDLVRANNAATVLHKDYPEKGMRWVELKAPKLESLPEGYRTEAAVTQDGESVYRIFDKNNELVAVDKDPIAWANKYDKTLADALKYEGEQLQHCVGGYCDDVISGRSRIYSLRDAKGKPNATIEVEPHTEGFTNLLNDDS
jgi:hypothetical protein